MFLLDNLQIVMYPQGVGFLLQVEKTPAQYHKSK